jgi:hypothetical protein
MIFFHHGAIPKGIEATEVLIIRVELTDAIVVDRETTLLRWNPGRKNRTRTMGGDYVSPVDSINNRTNYRSRRPEQGLFGSLAVKPGIP